MQRQMKFRVWDVVNKSFLQEASDYYWHVPFSLDGEEIEGESNLCSLSDILRHPDKFVIQQYTGVKDKDKKEIYEGDIVICDGEFTYKTGYVNFFAGIFFVNWPDQTDDELGYLKTDTIKVTDMVKINGNIDKRKIP